MFVTIREKAVSANIRTSPKAPRGACVPRITEGFSSDDQFTFLPLNPQVLKPRVFCCWPVPLYYTWRLKLNSRHWGQNNTSSLNTQIHSKKKSSLN